jgi:hypothetical protein
MTSKQKCQFGYLSHQVNTAQIMTGQSYSIKQLKVLGDGRTDCKSRPYIFVFLSHICCRFLHIVGFC